MNRVCLVVSLLGSLVFASAADAKPRKPRKAMTFTATAYCQHGTTASGERTRRGIVAADPRVIPLGSTVTVSRPGLPRRTYSVEDSGKHVKGRRIDIFMPSCRDARRFGRKTVQVLVVTRAVAADQDSEKRRF